MQRHENRIIDNEEQPRNRLVDLPAVMDTGGGRTAAGERLTSQSQADRIDLQGKADLMPKFGSITFLNQDTGEGREYLI